MKKNVFKSLFERVLWKNVIILVTWILMGALLLLGIGRFVLSFLPVSHFDILGDYSYDPEEIVSACGVRIGVGTGVIRHVRISNLTIEGAGTGIKYMTSYGGRGRAEIEDVNFSNVSIENVGFPIELLGDVGSIRHVTLDNIRARGMAGIRILGEGDCAMEDIALRNVDITVTPDVEMTESRRRLRGKYPICVHNVRGALLDGVRVFHEDDETDWEDVFDGSGSDLAVRNCNF